MDPTAKMIHNICGVLGAGAPCECRAINAGLYSLGPSNCPTTIQSQISPCFVSQITARLVKRFGVAGVEVTTSIGRQPVWHVQQVYNHLYGTCDQSINIPGSHNRILPAKIGEKPMRGTPRLALTMQSDTRRLPAVSIDWTTRPTPPPNMPSP